MIHKRPYKQFYKAHQLKEDREMGKKKVSTVSKVKSLVGQNAKAIVPVGIAGVLYVLAQVGVTGEMTVKELVTLGVTAGVVWFTKNRK